MTQTEKVGILGPWQTYSHAAAKKYLGTDENLVLEPSIDAVFAGIITQQLHSGIVPIWNSTCGLVSDTAVSILRRLAPPPGTCAATWWQCPLEVVDQLALPIHHCLAGYGTMDEIKKVTSKIQAIDQCQQWLADHLPNAERIPCDSTAAGLSKAKDDSSLAVIVSQEAALHSGTPILCSGIQDIENNHTEFLVIRRQEDSLRSAPISGDFEYWVAKEKTGAEQKDVDQRQEEVRWSDRYTDFGQNYQFVKVRSEGGKLTGISNKRGEFSVRWPLGWEKQNGG